MGVCMYICVYAAYIKSPFARHQCSRLGWAPARAVLASGFWPSLAVSPRGCWGARGRRRRARRQKTWPRSRTGLWARWIRRKWAWDRTPPINTATIPFLQCRWARFPDRVFSALLSFLSFGCQVRVNPDLFNGCVNKRIGAVFIERGKEQRSYGRIPQGGIAAENMTT